MHSTASDTFALMFPRPQCLLPYLLLAACGSSSTTTDTPDASRFDAQPGAADATPGLVDPDFNTRLRLIHQEVFREDDAFAAGGTGRLLLFAAEALPADDRESFTNTDGERCTYESGTEWPTFLTGDVEWPPGDLLNAGDLQFDVTDGPNQIVFEYYETAYIRKAPAAVVQGPFTHSSFFDGSNLPSGKDIMVSAVGGPDLGSFSFTATLPEDFVVSSPDIVGGTGTIDVSQAMDIAWSPADSESRMEVIVKDSFSFLRCNFADDGSATIPQSAMAKLNNGQFATFTVQAIRQRSHHAQVTDSGGNVVDIDFVAEHVKLGRFSAN